MVSGNWTTGSYSYSRTLPGAELTVKAWLWSTRNSGCGKGKKPEFTHQEGSVVSLVS